MKNKLLSLLIAAFLSAVWLFPYTFEFAEPVFAAALFAVFALLVFIPNKYVSFGASAALCIGVSIYDFRFLYAFVPAAMWLCGFFSAAGEKKPLPIPKDSFFLTMLLFTGLFSAVSLIASVSALVETGFLPFSLTQYYFLLLLLAAVWVWLAVRARKKRNALQGKAAREARDAYRKLFLLSVFQLICFAAVVLVALRQWKFAKTYFYPPVLCACALVLARDPASGEPLLRRFTAGS